MLKRDNLYQLTTQRNIQVQQSLRRSKLDPQSTKINYLQKDVPRRCKSSRLFVFNHLAINITLSLHLQEPHQERIGEDEFLFTESEFDMDELLILVDFYNRTFAELFVKYGAINRQCL